MFYISIAFLNVKRNIAKGCLTALVSMFVVLFLFLYVGSLQSNRRQLESLPDAIPVYARISNLSGSLTVGLLIQEKHIGAFEASQHINDLAYTVPLAVVLGNVSKEEEKRLTKFVQALGINSLSNYSTLFEDEILFMDGVDSDFTFLDLALCIADENFMKSNGLVVGDSFLTTIYYHTYPMDSFDLTYKRLGEFELSIVGSYKPAYDSDEILPPQIILSAKWVRKMFGQSDIQFNADSASFKLANPLEINEFKKEMKELGMLSVNPQGAHSHRGVALSVNDETFIQAVNSLKDNIVLMETFIPVIVSMICLIGYVLSCLLMNNKKMEIAIMRSLGISKNGCFAILLLESAMQVVLGSMLGLIISIPLVEMSLFEMCAVALLFSFCYLAGTAAAMMQMSRLNVMAALSALE